MKNFAFLFATLGLLACESSLTSEKFTYPEAPAITKLATPFQLQNGPTLFFAEDYLPEGVDSIQLPDGLIQLELDTPGVAYLADTNLPMESVIRLFSQGNEYDVILHKSRRIPIEITASKELFESAPTVFGTFNAWNRSSLPMESKGDEWSITLDLVPGVHEYKFYMNDQEFIDPKTEQVSNGMGGYNSILQVSSRGELPVELQTLGSENGFVYLKALPSNQKLIVLWENKELPSRYIQSTAEGNVQIEIPKVAFERTTSTLRFFSSNLAGWSRELRVPLAHGVPVKDARLIQRSDWNSARMYFMMVDRFANGDTTNDDPLNDPEVLPQADFKGGDIAGILEKLREGYFDHLGVNTLWLSPITRGPRDAWGLWDKGGVRTKFSAYHGYWPTSNTLIDSHFGDSTLVKQLLKEAHEKGYNVVLDYVANHIHQSHPLYANHPDWATNLYLPDGTLNTERWDDHRLTTWFDNHLPTLDLRKPEVVEPMTDSALTWVTDYEFDGFRHDATKHIDLLFWRTLTKKVKERVTATSGKEVYQIGETYGSPELIASYLSTGMLDAQFDFNAYDAIVGVLADTAIPVERIVEVMNNSWNYYGQHNTMGYISGNQDRSRFISIASGDVSLSEDQKLAGYTRNIGKPNEDAYRKLILLQVFNHSVPGIPVIYYGDEYGSPGANDPDNRRMMKFNGLDEDEILVKSAVGQLENLRASEMALLYGTAQMEDINNAVVHITRSYLGENIDIYINRSSEAQVISHSSNAHVLFGELGDDNQLNGLSALIIKTTTR